MWHPSDRLFKTAMDTAVGGQNASDDSNDESEDAFLPDQAASTGSEAQDAAMGVGGDAEIGNDAPPSCSYCGATDFKNLTDNGRAKQASCAVCGGTMSSVGDNQWTPELIGDPSNHPSPAPDPATGGVGGAANATDNLTRDPSRRASLHTSEQLGLFAEPEHRLPISHVPARTLSWDEIGDRHPHVYGDSEIHGEAADGGDGSGIGDTANYLAHERPGHQDAEDSSVHDLDFHEQTVHPRHIDYSPSGLDDARVQRAMQGYRQHPGKMPPLVLVHRHGVYQVADGHHRAEAADHLDMPVKAYVAHSPHPDEPFADGEKAPFHGAESTGEQHTAATDGPDWCSYRHAEHCWYPGQALATPQDRGVCPWTTTWQQAICPISDPGPLAVIRAKGSMEHVAEDDDWRLQHTAPGGSEDDVSAPLHDVESMMPDYYSHPSYYDTGQDFDHESHAAISRARGNPERKVRIYRGIPAEHAHKGIGPGDWVSTSKSYARLHGTQSDSKHDWPVISALVPAKHLHTEGDIHEWGYSGPPQAASVAFKGGYHQEVRQRADGTIKPVQRKPKTPERERTEGLKEQGYTFSHYGPNHRGEGDHTVVAYGPDENWAGMIKAHPDGTVHSVDIDPAHAHQPLEEHMRSMLPKHEASLHALAKVAQADPEFGFHFTAAWSDVRNKAKRIRSEGGVRITVASNDGVAGEVQGDHHVYESALTFIPGSRKIGTWNCGCRWAAFAWGRSPAYRRFEGRMCSHALAMQFEAQARGMFGREVHPDETRPDWLKPHTPVVIQNDRDTNRNQTRRAVPPGNMRSEWHQKSRVRVKSSLPAPVDGDTFASNVMALYQAQGAQEGHQTLYHITDNPDFALNPHHSPERNTVDIESATHDGMRPGIFLTKDPERWVNGHNYVRPYIAEIHAPHNLHEHEGVHSGGYNGETYVEGHNFDKLHVNRVMPLDAHAREEFGGAGWIEGHHGTAFDDEHPLTSHEINTGFRGYHYPGPDARDMSPQQRAFHHRRYVDYMVDDRGYDRGDFEQHHTAADIDPLHLQRAVDKARDEEYAKHQDDGKYAETYEPLHKSDLDPDRAKQFSFHHNTEEKQDALANVFQDLFKDQAAGVNQNEAPVHLTHYKSPVSMEPLHLDEHGNSWRRHYAWPRPEDKLPVFTRWSGPHSATETLDEHPTWSTSHDEEGNFRQHMRSHAEREQLAKVLPGETAREIQLRRNKTLREHGWGVVGGLRPVTTYVRAELETDQDPPALIKILQLYGLTHAAAKQILDEALGRVASWEDEEQRCPHCGGYLGPQAFKVGRCPHCGHALAHREAALDMPSAEERKKRHHHTDDARKHAPDFGYGVQNWFGLPVMICPQCEGSGCGHCGGDGQVLDTSSTNSPHQTSDSVSDQNPDVGPMMSGGISSTGATEDQGPWHIAESQHRDSIRDHGLRASFPESEDAEHGVYVWHSMPASEAVDRFDAQYAFPGQHYDVWKVHGQEAPQHDAAWEDGSGLYPHDIPAERISLKHTFEGGTRHHSGAKKADAPFVSGVALKAADTGRVLMIQRSNHDEKDPARGTWEFPGGHHEDGDTTSLHAGIREWQEETGQPFPDDGVVHHVWTSPNGVYQGHVVVVPSEKDALTTKDGRAIANPDDPDGDDHEHVAWWEVEHARKNPALRQELKKDTPWKEIAKAGDQKTASAWDSLESLNPPPGRGVEEPSRSNSQNPASTGFLTAQDPESWDSIGDLPTTLSPTNSIDASRHYPTTDAETMPYGYDDLTEFREDHPREATLHDEPEGALPTTDGADSLEEVEEHPNLVASTYEVPETNSSISPAESSGLPDDTRTASSCHSGELASSWQDAESGKSVEDIVARFQATAGAKALQSSGPSAPKGEDVSFDIAAAARAHLAGNPITAPGSTQHTALKDFSYPEQQDLINEGARDKVRARNFGDLQISGTHYEALSHAIAADGEDVDAEDLF